MLNYDAARQALKMELSQNDFEFLEEIGRGSFGVVMKVRSHHDNKLYVIKRINVEHVSDRKRREAMKEVQILKKLDHPNIIKYYGSFVQDSNLYIVMEYAEGGDLHRLLKRNKDLG
jgi:NIMA (never in mitosis gene a)-related kinase